MPVTRSSPFSIWVWAGLYFAAYVPFTAMTKALSTGAWPPGSDGFPGAAVLPGSSVAATLTAGTFLCASGWWRHAVRPGSPVPRPRTITALSGACTAVILITTTLAYGIPGTSVLLMVLALRAGVLVIAPVVDLLTGRRPRPASLVALGLALLAMAIATGGDIEGAMPALAWINLGAYLGAYFVRLQLMSRHAKSGDRETTLRYFAEEQLVITPLAVVLLAGVAAATDHGLGGDLRVGWSLEGLPLLGAAIVGFCSQGTGIFGTLVFLDPRENTFAVLVNRSASVLAGLTASLLLAAVLGAKPPATGELWGAGLLVAAIGVLALGDRRRAA